MSHIISVITDETFLTFGSNCYYSWTFIMLKPKINVITDGTFITLGSKCYYRWDLYYTWVQMLLQIGPLLHLNWVQMLLQMGPLLHLDPNVITGGTFITLGSKCYYRWDLYYAWVQMLLQMGPLLHWGRVINLVPSTNSMICSDIWHKYYE